MEELEPPIEAVQEKLHETAEHAREVWVSQVALYSALVAVVSAIAALLAGHHSNEAMISQIRASDSWAFYQAKGIKSAIINSKIQLLGEMGKPVNEKDKEKLEEYKKEQAETAEKASEKEKESEHDLRVHEVLARSVTMFQISIAISAISVLTRKRRFWQFGMIFGCIGLAFFLQGLFTK